MDYPHLFERMYLRPLAISGERFLAGHTVLAPRIIGGQSAPLSVVPPPERQIKPHRSAASGKRCRHCGPVEGDARFYNEPIAGVAAIPITGVLVHHASAFEEACSDVTDISAIGVALRQAVADQGIHTIVLDIDSPGGEVTGIPELGQLIRAARTQKRVYAYCDGQMCSAAYWLGSQAQEVFVSGSSGVGSIGVFCAWLDPAVKMQKEGVALRLFKAGKHKAIGLPGRVLSPEDEQLMQAGVDRVYAAFTTAVSSARPALEAAHFEAQVYDGAMAVAHRLADGIVPSWEEMLTLL